MAQPVSVGEYLYAWLQTRRPDLAPNTWRAYDQHVRLYVLPTLGGVKLHELTAMQVRAALAGMTTSQRTRHHTLATLTLALRDAEGDKLIDANPCRGVRVAKGRPQTVSLTAEQAKRLLAACEAAESVYGDCVAFALLTGLRLGEVRGLRWQDVSGGTVTVNQTLQYVVGKGDVVLPPKTVGSRRTLTIQPEAVEVLSRCKARQKVVSIDSLATIRGVDGVQGALVFVGVKTTTLNTHFKVLLRRAGCPNVRFHDLRHSWVSLSLEAGASLVLVSAMAGHSSIRMTADTYSHLPASMQAEAVAALGALLRREEPQEQEGMG